MRSLHILAYLDLVSVVLGWNHVSSSDFENVLAKNDLVLVAFLAPWMESSKSLDEEWFSVKEQVAIPVLSVDCTAEIELCKKQEVISYPAIRLLRKDKGIQRYRGPRKSPDIVSFLVRSEYPTVSVLDRKNVTGFKFLDEITFVAFPGPNGAVMESSFKQLAEDNKDRFLFGLGNGGLAESQRTSPDCIVAYKMHREEPKQICGEWRLELLQKFVETASAPLIGELTRRNELKYLRSGKSLIYVLAVTEEERNEFRANLRPLAMKYAEFIMFITVDALEYAEIAPNLGLKAGVFPAVALQNPSVGQIFPYHGHSVTLETVDQFVTDIVEGRIQPGTGEREIKHTEL